MALLDILLVLAPDSVAVAAAPKGVVLHTCSSPAPYDNVVAICATIIACLLIVAVAICVCMKMTHNARVKELEKRIKAEKEKREDEQKVRMYKEQYDSAWRCLKEFYKERGSGVTEAESNMAKAFWNYLANQFSQSDVSDKSDKSDASKSTSAE